MYVYLLIMMREGAIVHIYDVVSVVYPESEHKEKLDNFKEGDFWRCWGKISANLLFSIISCCAEK